MSLISYLFPKKKQSWHAVPTDPQWRRDPRGRFFRLHEVDVDGQQLHGSGGVYVLWHGGIRPRWVGVSATDDLGSALSSAADDPDIRSYEVHGGVYVTWSPVRREFRPGVVAYLTAMMCPILKATDTGGRHARAVDVVPVLMPL